MSKRLILILALVFAVGLATAYAEVQNVKVSGDITAYGLMRELRLNNNQGGTESRDKHQALLSIVRVRIDADLTDNVAATVRLINDRYWGSNDADQHNTDIDLDLAYVTLKEFLYSPLTLTVGKQELHFGNDMIVGDPFTNNVASGDSNLSSDPDLSTRKAFDAIRLTLNYDPLVVDVIGAKIQEDTTNHDDDVNLYGINANYPLNKNTVIEGYWFEKNTQRKKLTANKPDRVDTLGGRIVTKPMENLTAQLEAACQLGRAAYVPGTTTEITNPVKRTAWALETALTYDMPKAKYTPSLTAMYAFFSGQKDDDKKKVTAWDPMFENQKFGDIANAQFNQSNAHVLGLVGTMKALEDVTLKGEYYAYWWDKVYGPEQSITTVRGDTAIMDHKKFAGSELDLTATYDYTEDVQFKLLTGIFWPGSAFNKRTDNTATEVIGSMKVTF
jgi:hypothetical protein